MATVEVIHEPQPAPRAWVDAAPGIRGSVQVTLIDAKTKEVVGHAQGATKRNERTSREERKY